jgi:hypothetical protein
MCNLYNLVKEIGLRKDLIWIEAYILLKINGNSILEKVEKAQIPEAY